MSLGIMYSGVYGVQDQDEKARKNAPDVYVAYNFYTAPVKLALPKLANKKKWYLALDSSREEEQILKKEQLLKGQQYVSVEAQSICVLVG